MLEFLNKEKQETSSSLLDVDAIRQRIEERHLMTFNTVKNIRRAIDATVHNINKNTYLVSPYKHTTFEFVRRTRFYMPLYARMLSQEVIDLTESYEHHPLTEILSEMHLDISNILQYASAVEGHMLKEHTV